MENKISLSVILPIKTSKEKGFQELFDKSIQSLRVQKVNFEELIIVPSIETDLINFLNSYNFDGINVRIIRWSDEADYSKQVNLGINESKTEWVSIFEFDDEYSPIWFKKVLEYSEVYPEVQGFLPVVVDTDDKNSFAGFTNEATFAANFTMEMGYLTNETLHNYQNFQTAGAVFKKQIFEDFGGFKSSIKLTFIYELLLRLTYNSVSIMTIPKIGYKHTNMREGSLFWDYKFGSNKMSEDEIKFWIQTAKKEYFFVDDRVIKYEPQTT